MPPEGIEYRKDEFVAPPARLTTMPAPLSFRISNLPFSVPEDVFIKTSDVVYPPPSASWGK